MAVICRKGCLSVRRYREQKERQQSAAKVGRLAGTKLGNLLGVENKSDREELKQDGTDEGCDYKNLNNLLILCRIKTRPSPILLFVIQ